MQPDVLFLARATAPTGAGGAYFSQTKKVIVWKIFIWRKQFQAPKVEPSSLTSIFRKVRGRLLMTPPFSRFFWNDSGGKFEKHQRQSWRVQPA
jgi:hypothetical protein